MHAAGRAASAIFLFFVLAASSDDAFAGFEHRFVGARGIGTSGTLTAFGDDPWSFYYNPARTAETNGLSVYFSPAFFGLWEIKSTGISYSGKLFGLDIGTGLGTFGLESYRETVTTLNLSVPIYDFIFAGANANFNHLYIKDYGTEMAVSVDAGLRAFISERFALGLAVTNLTSSSMTFSNDRLPQSLAGGIAYISEALNIGVDYYKEIGFPPAARVAAEYSPVRYLTVRAGTASGTNSFSAGFTTRIHGFAIEYGALFHEVLGTTHMFGISIMFGGGDESEYRQVLRYREQLGYRRGD